MKDVDFSITISSGYDSVVISSESVFRPLSVEGMACCEPSIASSDNMLVDGSYIHARKINERIIKLSFEVFPMNGEATPMEAGIYSMNSFEVYRNKLIHFLNPKKDFKMTIQRGNAKRSIDCILKSAKIVQPTLRSAVTVEAAFLCPLPYFADDEETIYSHISSVPLFSFPFNSVSGYGITMGKSYKTNVFNIENRGDVDIGVVVTIYADGKVVNPKISFGDKYIKINDTMQSGDVYMISTEQGNKRIEKNGDSNFCFDRSSVFFSVPCGSGTVTITADSGEEYIRSVFSYQERYLGI